MILKELLTTNVGLMSLAAVIVAAGVGVFMYFCIRAMMRAESGSAPALRRSDN